VLFVCQQQQVALPRRLPLDAVMGVELPLVISDHADWDELTATVRELNPKELWVTHGRDDALVHWCAMHQIRARALHLVGREDEDD
jgi:putative mRNA 3-end processing factor